MSAAAASGQVAAIPEAAAAHSGPQPGTATLPRVAAVLGPTGSGKTALAVRLAGLGLPIEVVCCDATQLIAGLDAGTAKPSAAERAAVPHWLIDATPWQRPIDAAQYATLANEAIADIDARRRWPLLVGGTGLYHRALVQGLADIPQVERALRAALAAEAEVRGIEALWRELQEVDPDYAAATPPTNRQRVLRALEVYRATGRAFSAWHRDAAGTPSVRSLDFVLLAERDWLRDRLAVRAALMVPPLLVEAATLLAEGVATETPALKALGYRRAMAEAASLQRGETTAAEASRALGEALTADHRAYARRQRTWFGRLEGAVWLDAQILATDALQPAQSVAPACEARPDQDGAAPRLGSLEEIAARLRAWFEG